MSGSTSLWAKAYWVFFCGASIGQDPERVEPASEPPEKRLLRLASEHFERIAKLPGNIERKLWNPALTESEVLLIQKAAAGNCADYTDYNYYPEEDAKFGPPYETNHPRYADSWGEARLLRAEVLAWLCLDKESVKLVGHRGLQVRGARVVGNVDLRHATIPFPLKLINCQLENDLVLESSRVRLVELDGTRVRSVLASRIQVEGSVLLRRGFAASSLVDLASARILGALDCSGRAFFSDSPTVLHRGLDAEKIDVMGDVDLGFVKSSSQINISGARIGGNLSFNYAEIRIDSEGTSLRLEGAEIQGSILLKGFESNGRVVLYGARVGRDIEFQSGEILLNNSGRLRYSDLGLTEAHGRYSAVYANQISVGGSLLFLGLRTKGEIRLLGARVGGNFECDGAEIAGPEVFGTFAMLADRADVSGNVFLRSGFAAKGEVNLREAIIGGDLDCKGGTFENAGGNALNADGVQVKGCVFLCKVVKVHNNSRIPKQVQISGTVDFENAEIGEVFHWRDLREPANALLRLQSARVGALWDEVGSWPGTLWLDGFTYVRIHADAPMDAEARLKWLRLDQPLPFDNQRLAVPPSASERNFNPQPFEQLAAVLKKQGHVEDSRKILIAKENDRDLHRQREMSWLGMLWRKVLKRTIRYGYEPWQVWPYVVGFVGVGWGLFGLGKRMGVMGPVNERAYLADPEEHFDDDEDPQEVKDRLRRSSKARRVSGDHPKFCAFLYSLDEFLPLINLRQGDFWIPNVNPEKLRSFDERRYYRRLFCWILRVYLRVHILAGWTLTTLLLASFTGLVQR